MNASQNVDESCFIINNLFATMAKDTLDWWIEENENSPFTYSTTNHDLRNVKLI